MIRNKPLVIKAVFSNLKNKEESLILSQRGLRNPLNLVGRNYGEGSMIVFISVYVLLFDYDFSDGGALK